MVCGNVRDWLGQQNGENINKITEHGVTICGWWVLWYDVMRVPLHGLRGREGFKAHSHSLGQVSLLRHSYQDTEQIIDTLNESEAFIYVTIIARSS